MERMAGLQHIGPNERHHEWTERLRRKPIKSAALNLSAHNGNHEMKKLLFAVLVAASGLVFTSSAQAAAPAKTVASVNLRAGPSTKYPVVVTMPPAARIALYGCNANTTWCDVRWGAERGWVSAHYITVTYRGAAVVVTPAIVPAVGITVVGYNQAYWHAHYVGRPWYGRWNYYYGRPAAVVRRGGGCVGSACGGGRVVTGPHGGQRTVVRGCGPNRCGRAAITRGPNGGVFVRGGGFRR